MKKPHLVVLLFLGFFLLNCTSVSSLASITSLTATPVVYVENVNELEITIETSERVNVKLEVVEAMSGDPAPAGDFTGPIALDGIASMPVDMPQSWFFTAHTPNNYALIATIDSVDCDVCEERAYFSVLKKPVQSVPETGLVAIALVALVVAFVAGRKK